MKKLNVTFVRSYRSKNSNVTFVYKVTGSKENIEAYKAIQKDFAREDEDGNSLWFTTRFIGKTGSLLITTNDKVVPDMSAFDQAASISAQYGGNFGQELAKAAAHDILRSGPVTEESPE